MGFFIFGCCLFSFFFPLGLIICFPLRLALYRLPTEIVCKLGNPDVFSCIQHTILHILGNRISGASKVNSMEAFLQESKIYFLLGRGTFMHVHAQAFSLVSCS